MQHRTLRLILGDQLNANHSWYRTVDDSTLYLIAELHQEAAYVAHHIQKVSAFFAAMEHFAQELKQLGHNVIHLNLDLSAQFEDLPSLINDLILQYNCECFEFQRPDEYRLYEQLHSLAGSLSQANIRCREYDTEHFLLPFNEIQEDFPPGKHVLMEHFYRRMRRRFDLLMDGDKPLGGKWNFDKSNRNKLKKHELEHIPSPLCFSNNVNDILNRIAVHQVRTIGQAQPQLLWPVTTAQAQELLHFFCQQCLPFFGCFQDAMTEKSPHSWSLYHSRLSFALNAKLLSPTDVLKQAICAYEQNSSIDLAQIEGFVRQIIGWREYIRAMYWANMPNYKKLNALKAERKLPDFFWTGHTKMACMKAAITQSLDYAYAHHIQRLMVTGNFCLLTGIAPDEVEEWYLGIYIDAIEWVEMPNTRGMALFADNGIIATKPYAASGNYINKMSDHCKHCNYDVKTKTEANSCPLNSLYWNFLHQHESWLAKNHRTRMIYRSWDNLKEQDRKRIIAKANRILKNIDNI
ncbi:cryptochrome/photolyase family protein [Photobacterium sp. ZSDE20]|uniref:Cryptochrome/photolyase family protein n=1 Tax=Photobacterium pectinilyticum TaxID=2906793 RepID=A0ABT1NB02_9GAMM|nr:cryptochrome/photolyase family protein [Photobacterium sp. ZSDE20]MCQ1060866.1 cryptochrome/photolyase family protein [Photobacterium sp. ZSDE20]MDD1828689.1 cryptochrome/photolyase family protein [Photobacterium sp. ZSDE20]